ncbi:AraC family transcriptional regulator [Amycolatopsis sp. NPDC049253]|uniref:AraC family transcriptional regulator n=1 Tax=Amycolatopsis sp. NPDC049253 TaxID=3155274 RepID=UPI00343031D2
MAAVVKPEVDTRDPDEARSRLSDVYCPHRLDLVGGARGFVCRQSSRGFAKVRLFDLVYGGAEVRVDPVPFDDFVLVTRPLKGRFAVRSTAEGLVGAGPGALVMDAYGSYQLRWYDSAEVLNTVLDRDGLERIAAELRGWDEPRPVRFALGAPASAAAARRWDTATRLLLEETRSADGMAGSPLLAAQLFRLAATALLEAYPSTSGDPEGEPAGQASPAAVRRAEAFIELNAAEDIGLLEIAAAARLSVRGLQAAFSRAGRPSPVAYLRETRLRRAHAELRERSPAETTVASVAARWGFGNAGRFSAEHRRLFGCGPSEALRGNG